MAAYATSADLINYFDARLIKDLCLDAGAAETTLATNAAVTAALLRASGRVDASLRMGGRYTAAQLAAVSGNTLEHLKGIVCDIAAGTLMDRRGFLQDADRSILALARTRGEDALKLLTEGKDVFDIDSLIDAANPTVDGPSTTTIRNLNLIVDRTRNYYPARIQPNGR